MKKNATLMFVGLLVVFLASTTAWAELDPRDNFGTCGFTSVEETWEPDAGGTLTQRVTYVSQCDTPSAGDETITITTEDWNGSSLEVTEVREALRTNTGGIFNTTTLIYDGGLALTGMEEHTYDNQVTIPTLWYQDWTIYTWDGSGYVLADYTIRETEILDAVRMETTYLYFDKVPMAFPSIPVGSPAIGVFSGDSVLPPLDKGVDSLAYENLGRMYERVRNTLMVNPNTQQEGDQMLQSYGLPALPGLVPPGMYVSGVLKGHRRDDPGTYNGFFQRWTRFANTIGGDLEVLFGWTSDRDLNEPTGDWWQARVRQSPAGGIEAIENSHRVGETEEDHYDTYTVLNGMFMIDSQTVKVFDFDEGNPGNFTETTTVTDGMASPVSHTVWTVAFD